jgi:hypothetical protein
MKTIGFGLSTITFAVLLFVGSIAHAGDLVFKKHVISDQTDYSAAALIDVNHDGQIDIVCGGDWYEGPNWEQHFVAEIPRIRGRPDGFAHLEFDVNRDGWVDVITVNYRSRSIKWMEHPGESLGPWTTHVAVEPGPMETGRLVDIDGDGQLDLLPNGANFAAWWEFRWDDKSRVGEPAWIRHELPTEAGGHGLGFGDIDGDGRGDIVGQHGWLQAPLDARHGHWTWHAEFSLERASIPMIVADVDDDGDNDVVWSSAHGFGVYWLEQVRNASGDRVWNRHAIDTSWSQGHSPLWVDLDGDGRKELVTGKRYMAHGGADPGEYDPIAIYRYQFSPETRTWQRWTVSPIGQRVGVGLDPKVADIDGDGDLDLMASGRSGLFWLENLGPKNDSIPIVTPVYQHDEGLLVVKDGESNGVVIDEPEGWGRRRTHISATIEAAIGTVPNPNARVPLGIVIERESSGRSYRSQRIQYNVDATRNVSATLLTPNRAADGTAAGLVCMFDSPQRSKQIAGDLTDRGFVCIAPELAASGDPKPLIDQIWQVMRAADVLQASNQVHGERIGFVGDAAAGQLGLYVAALDQRFIATVTDAGRMSGTAASWQSSSYSLAELLASVAPRSLNVVTSQDAVVAAAFKSQGEKAAAVFSLRNVPDNLILSNPTRPADFGEKAYVWLEGKFRR